MIRSTKKYSDIWKSPDEYFHFARQFNVWGAAAIKKKLEMQKTKNIGEPKIEK